MNTKSKEKINSKTRRDQEFVTRLASDLNAQVAGVWFDQATIQLGQNWHDEIMEGIQECKAFILVLSPDAMESRYVREELNKALELGKTIFPVIYRPARWKDEFKTLVREVQTLDLRSGSYTESFHKLVDGLVEAGAGKQEGERPFIRPPVRPGLDVLLSKVPGWALAWSAGWLVFWVVVLFFLGILVSSQEGFGGEDVLNFLVILLGAGTGGFIGGLLAGLLTMIILRLNAPSVSWKHMSPTIRIWAITGPLGLVVSGLITVMMLALGAISAPSVEPECSGVGLGECMGQILGSALGKTFGLVILVLLVFLLFVLVAWFLTGMFAGWQVVRHIRRLEPGITRRQGWQVSTGWGCGAIAAAIVMIVLIGLLSSALEL